MSDYLFKQVARFSPDELLEANKLVNDRIAAGIGDVPEPPPLNPISASLPTYVESLGDGTRAFEGLSTGHPAIDELIGGLNRFILLAGRGGTGKSTLALQLAIGTALTEHVPILFYSYEMDRRSVQTMLMQNLRRGHDYRLTRNEILLRGNAPGNSAATNTAITESADALAEIGKSFYVIDAGDGDPSTARMVDDIARVSDTHQRLPLIVIDSIQDLIQVGNAGSTAAEAETAQKIVELQMQTQATFLAISQKAKGGNFTDPYAAVLGSVSLIHKPTSVLELLGVHDLISQLKDREAAKLYLKLADNSNVPNPVVMRVIKGRNNGFGQVALQHYGKYSIFEDGRVPDYDVNQETSLYDLVGLTAK